MSTIYIKNINTPVGNIQITGTEQGIISVHIKEKQWENATHIPTCIRVCENQLYEYFSGNRTQFDLPLLIQGTSFQKKVWKQLQQIPYGTTISYKQLAEQIGHSKAVRAVGSANGKNKHCIIIPCHRVIASNGNMGGYSAGKGIETKRHLLDLEKGIR